MYVTGIVKTISAYTLGTSMYNSGILNENENTDMILVSLYAHTHD